LTLKGFLDVKKFVAIAAVAIMCGAALPAGAAVTVNGTVTVKWNTAVAASMTLATNYDAAGAQQLTAPTIVTQANTGSGACTAAGAGSEAAATVNFGSITPDFAQTTGCLYQNGVNAVVKTNSTNWTLTEATAAAPPAGATLCALANDPLNKFPFPATGALPATQTIAAHTAAYIAGTTCPANQLTLTAALSTAVTSTTAYPAGANIGQDMALLLTAANPLGANTVTVNYQVIAN
jgi:hypothetical protein